MRRVPAMRILGILLLLATIPAVLLLWSPGGDEGAPPRDVRLNLSDDGSQVALQRGGTLVVALPADGPDEPRWELAGESPSELVLDSGPIWIQPQASDPPVGAPGTQVFIFTARETGTFELQLSYPSAEGDEPAGTWKVEMEVH